MKVCTFFGHRDAPCTIKPQLHETLRYLVSKKHVDTFYVGNQGQFDHMVQHHLQMLIHDFPHIRCFIILHRLPTTTTSVQSNFPSLFPEGLEYSHPEYALVHRNRWMVSRLMLLLHTYCMIGAELLNLQLMPGIKESRYSIWQKNLHLKKHLDKNMTPPQTGISRPAAVLIL